MISNYEDQALLGEDSYSDDGDHPLLNGHSLNVDGLDQVGQEEGSSGEAIGATKVYKRRWYVLFIYGLFTCTFSAVWNCWGPIALGSEAVFGWSDSTIAFLTNLGPIAYMLSGCVFPYLLHVRGLRLTVLISTFIMSIGCTLRSLTSRPGPATVLIYIGQLLNGLIGPMAMAAIPQVSSVWFPPHQRVTATSISNSFCIFGYAASFLIGPALVSEVDLAPKTKNRTGNTLEFTPYNRGSELQLPYYVPVGEETRLMEVMHEDSNESMINQARNEIMRYMYIECGWCWFLFVAMLVYFPARPPLPPGRSALSSRVDYWGGLWSLKSNTGFLLVAFCYGVSTGVTAGWAAMLSVTLKPFGIGQERAGLIGFYSIAGSCIIAIFLCRLADYFIRHIKLFIVILYSLGTAAFLIFALITVHIVPYRIEFVYVTVIAGFSLTNGAIPLLFELACELAYPTSESAANGFLTFLNNLFCLLFLLVLSVPGVGTLWEHWTVTACCFVCIPMIIALKSRFNRLDLDELNQTLVVVGDGDGDTGNAASGSHDPS